MNQKLKNCAKQLKKYNYDSIILSDPLLIKYFTGIKDIEGYLLVTAGEELICFTNFLYLQMAKKNKGVEISCRG